MVKASQIKGGYAYNTIALVFLTECTKLIIAISIYLKEKDVKSLIASIFSHQKLFLLYFIPAALYCLYNNLAFVSLVNFDPTTYYVLLQLRMVVTGALYQVIFKRRLSRMQWLSLVLITIGCTIKNLHSNDPQHEPGEVHLTMNREFFVKITWIFVQIFCSCFAGVYTEFLVKDTGHDVHLMVQNVYMYVDSMVCNLIALLLTFGGDSSLAAFVDHPIETFSQILFNPLVLSVMINNALCGIITSLFLKSFNSILKIFASALELVITAIICWILFAIPIDHFTIASIFIVSLATYIYSQNPLPPPKVIEMTKVASKTSPKPHIPYKSLKSETV